MLEFLLYCYCSPRILSLAVFRMMMEEEGVPIYRYISACSTVDPDFYRTFRSASRALDFVALLLFDYLILIHFSLEGCAERMFFCLGNCFSFC